MLGYKIDSLFVYFSFLMIVKHYKITGDELEVYLRTANLSHFNDVDWKAIVFDIENYYVTLLHGFPGDNPVGLLFCVIDSVPVFIAMLGEHSNIYETKNSNIAKTIHEWYLDVTEDSCNYENEIWN